MKIKRCLRCGRSVLLPKEFFTCKECRKENNEVLDLAARYVSHHMEVIRELRKRGAWEGAWT